MKIAILLAGHTNKEMPAEFHDYNILFERAFAQSSLYDAFSFSSFAVVDDIFPDSIDEFDGFLITGSAYGVYDDVPFIAKLMDLVRQIHAARKPLAGICFGHQIIAHALGGHAQKWPHGWGLGIQQITLDDAPPWIETKEDTLNLIHMHQDQVIKLPKGARCFASSDFCAIAGYVIGNTVFAFQGHPEFTIDYTDALIDLIKPRVGDDAFAVGKSSLSKSHNGVQASDWILRFFTIYRDAA